MSRVSDDTDKHWGMPWLQSLENLQKLSKSSRVTGYHEWSMPILVKSTYWQENPLFLHKWLGYQMSQTSSEVINVVTGEPMELSKSVGHWLPRMIHANTNKSAWTRIIQIPFKMKKGCIRYKLLISKKALEQCQGVLFAYIWPGNKDRRHWAKQTWS